ncbi:MAG: pyrroline-5-carboxylate reductase [Deltaproteobacteria bacterium]|nr:pyrroline-5-carboxylate reductase [Deltaproteobacteria bacterium]
MRVLILGGGSIGEAFARAILGTGLVKEGSLEIVEVQGGRAGKLRGELKCAVRESVGEIASFRYLLIAVKPQDFAALAASLPKLSADQIVISVMAGVPIKRIEEALQGHKKIIRCMPNLPVVIGQGTIAFATSSAVGSDELRDAERILASGGRAVALESESQIDAVTALSGSGPAYLFYAVEKLLEVGVELGLTEEQARSLILNTIKGAAAMVEKEPHSLKTMRAAVTSKGGTTAAAIEQFERGGLGETLKEGVRSACLRAKELARQS